MIFHCYVSSPEGTWDDLQPNMVNGKWENGFAGSGVTLQHLMLGVLGLKRRRSASIGQINCKDRTYLD